MTSVKAILLWIAFFILDKSPAPKNCAITTPAPVEIPIKKPISILIIGVLAPTAARATFPT